MKRCPKCGNTTFEVTASVTQLWLVDSNGDFLNEISSCEEVLNDPDDRDTWICARCGYDAAGSEFNVKE